MVEQQNPPERLSPDAIDKELRQLERDLDAALKDPAAKPDQVNPLLKRVKRIKDANENKSSEQIYESVMRLRGKQLDGYLTLDAKDQPPAAFWPNYIDVLLEEPPAVSAQDVNGKMAQMKQRAEVVDMRKEKAGFLFSDLLLTADGKLDAKRSANILQDAKEYLAALERYVAAVGTKPSPALAMALLALKPAPKQPEEDPNDKLVKEARELERRILAMQPGEKDKVLEDVTAFARRGNGIYTDELAELVSKHWPERVHGSLTEPYSKEVPADRLPAFLAMAMLPLPAPKAANGPGLRDQTDARDALQADQNELFVYTYGRITGTPDTPNPLGRERSEKYLRMLAAYLHGVNAYEKKIDPAAKPKVTVPDELSRYLPPELKEQVELKVVSSVLRMQYDVGSHRRYFAQDQSPREVADASVSVANRVIQNKEIKVRDLRALAASGTANDDAYMAFLQGKCGYRPAYPETVKGTRMFTGYALKRVAIYERQSKRPAAEVDALAVGEVLRLSGTAGISEFSEAFYGQLGGSGSPLERLGKVDFNALGKRLKAGTEIGAQMAEGLLPENTPQAQRAPGVQEFVQYAGSGIAETDALRDAAGGVKSMGAAAQGCVSNLREKLKAPDIVGDLLRHSFLPPGAGGKLRADVEAALRDEVTEGKLSVNNAFELYCLLRGPTRLSPMIAVKVISVLHVRNAPLANSLQAHVCGELVGNMADDVNFDKLGLDDDQRIELNNFTRYMRDEIHDRIADDLDKFRKLAMEMLERLPGIVANKAKNDRRFLAVLLIVLLGPTAFRVGKRLTTNALYARWYAVLDFLDAARDPEKFLRDKGLAVTPERVRSLAAIRELVAQEKTTYEDRKSTYRPRYKELPRILRPFGALTNAIQLWREGRVKKMDRIAGLAGTDLKNLAKGLADIYGTRNTAFIVEQLFEVNTDPKAVTEAATEAGCKAADVKAAVDGHDARATAYDAGMEKVASDVEKLQKENADLRGNDAAQQRLIEAQQKAIEALTERVAALETARTVPAPDAAGAVPEGPRVPADVWREVAKHRYATIEGKDWKATFDDKGNATFEAKDNSWKLNVDSDGKMTSEKGTPPITDIQSVLTDAAKGRTELIEKGLKAELRPAVAGAVPSAAPVDPGRAPERRAMVVLDKLPPGADVRRLAEADIRALPPDEAKQLDERLREEKAKYAGKPLPAVLIFEVREAGKPVRYIEVRDIKPPR